VSGGTLSSHPERRVAERAVNLKDEFDNLNDELSKFCQGVDQEFESFNSKVSHVKIAMQAVYSYYKK
jgi:hypothetical protein